MKREKLLDECALILGSSWARAVCDATRKEHRRVAGGFPGTVAEARWRVAGHLGAELMRLALLPLQDREIASAVQIVYAQARRDWLGMVRNEALLARNAHAKAKVSASAARAPETKGL